MLTAAQQERYARHLLLDGFGGEGQERLLAAAVHVRGEGHAALWAARYLAASGVGRLDIERGEWQPELRGIGPEVDVRVVRLVHGGPENVRVIQLVQPAEAATPAQSAMNGARAALEIIREIAR